MRVGLVSNEFAPFHGAGIGTYASLMAAAWAGAGHEVHVLTGPHPGVLEHGPRLRPGVEFHTVDPSSAAVGTGAERYALAVLAALERQHASRPFDYVEFPDYGGEGAYVTWARRSVGALAGAVLGVRLHTPRRECRALNQESWLDEEGARVDALEDGAIRRADVLISPSASLLEIVRARLGGAAGWPREAVVPYPFDRAAVAELLPEAGADPPPDAGGPPTVLYYGRLERRKGVHLLTAAARRIIEGGVPARFWFIGGDTPTGPMGSSMRAHVEGLAGPHAGAGIVFEPPRPRHQLGEAIRAAALVCAPSLWENFPNVVLESMALGAAVVGSDAGGTGEIIRDGRDGLLFRAGDGADLERVLRVALAGDALRRRIGAAAPGRIGELCDPKAVVARTITAVEGARSASPSTPPGPVSASVIVIVGDVDGGLGETLASISRQGRRVTGRTVVLRAGGGPGRAVLAARTAATAQGAGFDVRVLEPCGPGAARNAALRGLGAEWVLFVEPGDVLESPGFERLLTAPAREPGVSWIGGLARSGDSGPAPIGLDRDLLAGGVMPGPGLVRVDAVVRAGGWEDALVGDGSVADWALGCRLAASGEPWTLTPWVVLTRPDGRGAPPAAGAVMMHILGSCPGLPAEPGRVIRILAARAGAAESRAGEADAARRRLAERVSVIEATFGSGEPPPGPRRAVHFDAVYRQRMMESNLRYRIAERVNNALKATGVQRPLKAAVRWARGLARRLAGG